MTDYPEPRSGGMLTLWQEIDIVCLCENNVFSFGAGEGDVEVVTCANCGQQYRVTCKVEEIDPFDPTIIP